MDIIIGIDIGGSTTKIIGIDRTKILTPLLVHANDPVASLFGALGKFVTENAFTLADIREIMITGVGASYISSNIYGIKTTKVQEFLAIGLGGLFLSDLRDAVIVSMGTGTAFVKATEGSIEHIGGTGIGGGTILGLSGGMLNIRDLDLLIRAAESGCIENVDLRVGDLTRDILPGLPPDTTASNFGKISDIASHGDIALGIFNLVFQTIGTMAFFSVRNTGIKDIVLTGNLSTIPQCKTVFTEIQKLYGINFVIPNNSEYATAVGAALAHNHSNNLRLA